jgi:cyanophycin synthetase
VLETARGGILREGLAFDECLVGVVTNVTADHLGLRDVHTLDDLARVKQVVVEAVSREGAAVLNAEDPLVAEMAAACDGRVVYFSRTPEHHIMAAHLAEGETGFFVEDGAIVLATGQQRTELVELTRIPFTFGGKIDFQVMNALAATAAAWAAGLNPAMIVRALTTFRSDSTTVPGRFNFFDLNGIEVIVDYGHNQAALEALGQAILSLPPRHTIMVMTLPGDRRDQDLINSGITTLPYVDGYILYDAKERRGRAVNEVPELIRRHLPADTPCEIVPNEDEAIQRGCQIARSGDRFIIICDDPVEKTLATLSSLAESTTRDQACAYPVSPDASELFHRKSHSFPAPRGVSLQPSRKNGH